MIFFSFFLTGKSKNIFSAWLDISNTSSVLTFKVPSSQRINYSKLHERHTEHKASGWSCDDDQVAYRMTEKVCPIRYYNSEDREISPYCRQLQAL